MVVPKVSEFYYGMCAGQGLDVPLFIKGTANVLKLEPGDFGLYAIEFPQADAHKLCCLLAGDQINKGTVVLAA